MINKQLLIDCLTDGFILYQQNLDEPMPHLSQTEATRIAKYRTDPMFRCRVDSLVSGVMQIVSKVENEQ